MHNIKIIIGGGGTGGHIFPALAIANEVKCQFKGAEILFVGADNRMEMERVPKAGYQIVGLPVRGFYRKLTLKNLGVLRSYFKSLKMAKKIVADFKPNIVVGVGGYASAPVVRAASAKKIPTLIQEQNSYAGLTNRMLSKKVQSICVAYTQMGKYFPNSKIKLTGNPVRHFQINDKVISDGYAHFKLTPQKPVVLIIGGSLGARSINNAMKGCVQSLLDSNIQVLWQCGKYYYTEMKEAVKDFDASQLKLMDFITDMEKAYAIADLVVSRAGALSISEICLLGKASLLVPSPNVAEDHQTKNAMALANNRAAIFLKDADVVGQLGETILQLLNNKDELNTLSANAKKMAFPDATKNIVAEIIRLCK